MFSPPHPAIEILSDHFIGFFVWIVCIARPGVTPTADANQNYYARFAGDSKFRWRGQAAETTGSGFFWMNLTIQASEAGLFFCLTPALILISQLISQRSWLVFLPNAGADYISQRSWLI